MYLSLREIRCEKELTLRELQRISGVPRSTIDRLERGGIGVQVWNLQALAQALGVYMEDLIEPIAPKEDQLPSVPKMIAPAPMYKAPMYKDEVVWWWERS